MYLNIIGQQIEIFILKSGWFNNFKFHIVFKTCYTQHTQIKEQTNKFIENILQCIEENVLLKII